MTQPHAFTPYELQMIAVGVTRCNKDWRMVQRLYLPHLNHISIKNKYYKMLKQGQIAAYLATEQKGQHSPESQSTPSHQLSFKTAEQTPGKDMDDLFPKSSESEMSEDEKVLQSLCQLALRCFV